jgi:hypothetical protein
MQQSSPSIVVLVLTTSFSHRIYKTFIMVGAPMELNISTQDQVKRKMESLRWSIVNREEALDTLKDTEIEVLALLVRDTLLGEVGKIMLEY